MLKEAVVVASASSRSLNIHLVNVILALPPDTQPRKRARTSMPPPTQRLPTQRPPTQRPPQRTRPPTQTQGTADPERQAPTRPPEPTRAELMTLLSRLTHRSIGTLTHTQRKDIETRRAREFSADELHELDDTRLRTRHGLSLRTGRDGPRSVGTLTNTGRSVP